MTRYLVGRWMSGGAEWEVCGDADTPRGAERLGDACPEPTQIFRVEVTCMEADREDEDLLYSRERQIVNPGGRILPATETVP